ncbi:MAG: hypothetical protein ABI690_33225 [Chloroflexota bacterium]
MVGKTPSTQRLPSIPERLSRLLRRNDYLFRDLLLLIAICIPLTYFVEVTLIPRGEYVSWGDNPWYLNRGLLLARGVADGAFVYTLAYPIVVSLVNSLTHDLITAGILINRVLHSILIIGTYGLGRIFYNRRVGWFAALLIGLNVTIFLAARLTQSYLMFYAMVVVCVLAYAWLVRRPTLLHAVLFGVVLVITFYTRLEGITYGLLIPLAAWQMYRSTRSAKIALGLPFISGLIVAASGLFYMSVMLRNSDPQNGVVFTLFSMLRSSPFPWAELGRRFVDSIFNTSIGWPPLVAVGAALGLGVGLLRGWRRDLAPNALFGLLIVIGVANLFVLSIVPKLYIGAASLPFWGLLFAAFVVQVQTRWRGLWPFAVLTIMLAAVSGLILLAQYITTARDDYHLSRLGQDAIQIDAWLADQGWQDREVYTFCSPLISYSQSRFHLIYRLGIRDMQSADNYNSPAQLLPMLRDQQKLFMGCPENIVYFRDWNTYFEGKMPDAPPLHEIGRVGSYIFYDVK